LPFEEALTTLLSSTKYAFAKQGKVYLVSDLPLIGGLFRPRNRTERESELLMLVTPNTIGAIFPPILTAMTPSVPRVHLRQVGISLTSGE
jgi:Flp pilus assembly secretin CpaC